ncbi:MAG: thioredoxin domain-containing protein [Candidatus Paceibacterota bacterium]
MENTTQQKISTPMAIVVAGVLIMVGILLTNGIGGGEKVVKEKTLSEQVGVSKVQLTECIQATDTTALAQKIQTSVESAMKGVPADQRGTPYSIIIGKNGVKTEVRGALPIEGVNKLIDEVTAGKVTAAYTGEVPAVDANDHIIGSPDAPIVIVEYSDYECSYCKSFHITMNQVVAESDGNVIWVYRHWPIHQNSMAKLVAAECVAQIKGNDAFWKYTDLLFGLLNPAPAPVTDQL